MVSKQVSRVTAVLNPVRAGEVIHALQREGIRHLSIEAGRAPVLEPAKGFCTLLSSRSSRLVSDPVDTLSFYVESCVEDNLIGLIADKARLSIPGMGVVYSETIDMVQAHALCSVNEGQPGALPKPENLYPDVVGISCTVVRGEADRIARVVLESGACVPTITFGIGTGVRDKLGLLRITLPAEKEVITSVMSSYDAASVMELMIAAGRLEQIGRGIIYVFPVKQGILNPRIARGTYGQAASMEQIIATLDGLKGGMEWRRRGMETDGDARKFLRGRLNLSIECDEGRGPDLVKAAMGAGAGGATINRCKFVSTEDPGSDLDQDRISPAREICNLLVNPDSLGTIIAALLQAGALDDETHGLIATHLVPRAFAGTA